MSFPLFPQSVFGHDAGLVYGVVLGMAFGFVLERSGFGRAGQLAAQFYGRDNRVLKVMFTAIATTATLLGLLAGVGLLDLGQLTVPETFLGPQIVGGLLLGVGFVVAGYCPGTAVVATAAGRIDGMLAYVGVMLGTLVFGAFWPWLEAFYQSGAMGSVRLDQVFGLPFAVVALGVVAMAVGAFVAVEKLEAFLASRRGTVPPDLSPVRRNFALGSLALLAVIALFPRLSPPAAAQVEPGRIEALDLATRMVERPDGLWLVDLACAEPRIPGAVCSADAAGLPATRTMVVYGEGALPAYAGEVVLLEGGYAAFAAAVLRAPELPAEPTLAQLREHQRKAALNGWFTGQKSTPAAAPVAVKKSAGTVAKKGGGC